MIKIGNTFQLGFIKNNVTHVVNINIGNKWRNTALKSTPPREELMFMDIVAKDPDHWYSYSQHGNDFYLQNKDEVLKLDANGLDKYIQKFNNQ